MSQAAAALQPPVPEIEEPAVIVVGSGPVGMHLANRLRQHAPSTPIKVFGKENCTPYDRVGLSSFLAGQRSLDQLLDPSGLDSPDNTDMFVGRAIVEIDRNGKRVKDQLGTWHPYTELFLATGSVPHVPDIPGKHLSGVFRFRDMKDALGLMARSVRTRHTVIIGGGLLGIEAARAMAMRASDVTLVQHSDRLMNRQLDQAAAQHIQTRLEQSGVKVMLNTRVASIEGEQRVAGVRMQDGSTLACDTVIFTTGIRPSTELARSAGLAVADGIRIDQQARTNDPLIFAGGECAQYEDEMFGLVAPGLEQASVAASTIAGETASYNGSIGASRLKVLGVPCFSAGRVSDAWQHRVDQTISWEDESGDTYRRLFFERGKLVGAMAIGALAEQSRLHAAIQQQTLIWPWQRWRFKRTGQLWPDGTEQQIATWPPTATVCQCRQVTRGELSQAMEQGHCTAAALTEVTGAASVCGSCEPLLHNLCGAQDQPRNWQSAVVMGLSILILGVIGLLSWQGPLGYAASVSDMGMLESLWRDNLARQISGYTLLGLSVVAAVLALRKRWSKLNIGRMANWRVIHLVVGLLALAALFVHTGMRIGSGSNLALMLVFLAIIIGGSLSGMLTARAERSPSPSKRSRAGSSIWLHILTLWPLPALLVAHIVKAYMF